MIGSRLEDQWSLSRNNNQRRIGNEIEFFWNPSTSCKHAQTKSRKHMTALQQNTIPNVDHTIFNKQKHWTTGKQIKVPNHYQSLYVIAHLVSVFIRTERCRKLQLCWEIQLAGWLSFGKTIKQPLHASLQLHTLNNKYLNPFVYRSCLSCRM